MTDTFVLLGPSLPADVAFAIYPAAIILPPAAVGDVTRLVRDHAPRRIALIDGYFERMAAVWHKELLFALASRVEVHGASSMGALRAAELAAFGMRGHGRVYADFARGRLTDDDEVAVAHLPAERGYAAASLAMVSIRAALASLRRRKVVTAGAHDALVMASKARFYRDRTWEAVVDDARALRLSARTVAAITAATVPDVKAADARVLLRHLARTPARRPAAPRWTFSRTWFWDRFVELTVEAPGDDLPGGVASALRRRNVR